MRTKLTAQGLKNYILDIALPEPFTLNDVLEKMRKHGYSLYNSYRHELRPLLTKMVEDKYLTEKIGSEERAHGSVTEIFYTKIWKDE